MIMPMASAETGGQESTRRETLEVLSLLPELEIVRGCSPIVDCETPKVAHARLDKL